MERTIPAELPDLAIIISRSIKENVPDKNIILRAGILISSSARGTRAKAMAENSDPPAKAVIHLGISDFSMFVFSREKCEISPPIIMGKPAALENNIILRIVFINIFIVY
jgi:hypothetical protein